MSRERDIYKVTLVGSAGNVALLAFKFAAGVLGHSSAMIADAIHSLSDFITDVVLLAFVHMSAKPQDEDHDYGHGKYETFATLIIGLAIMAAATGIIISGVDKLVDWVGGRQLAAPGWLALAAALLSIVVKEVMYRYTVRRGKALDSPALVANAWHHRSDALSSIGAAVGIGGAILLGNRWTVLDPLASVVVGLMLLKVAIGLLRSSVGELTEHSLSSEVEKEIEDIICSYPDVSDPHNLRTRRIGNRFAIEVHVRMDGNTTLTAAHNRATAIEQRIRQRFGKQTHISIHMEPVK
ncbi:MAG: cation transporter [Muribaculaceae bacterium]|nr:cation transporter [Muribaculaceae bacterium]